MFFNKKNRLLNFQSILIITYGRSGSTLLQGLLNSIDGCLIRGENGLFHYGFYRSYRAILETEKHGDRRHANECWYNSPNFNQENYLKEIKKLSRNMILGNSYNKIKCTCYGFKEVRYPLITKDFLDYLDFLKMIFPNPAYIFNTRDHKEVINSGWWKNKPGTKALKKIGAIEELFHQYHREHDNSFIINYRDVVDKTDKLKDLYSFLGADYHEKTIDRVLTTPHSFNPTQENIKSLFNKNII